MSKRFATGFERPVAAEHVPLTLTIAISPAMVQALYFERVYTGRAGELLAIRSTLIEARGLVLLHDAGPFPVGTASIAASVTNENSATEPDPVIVAPVEEVEASKFATDLEVPLLFGDMPLQLSMAIGKTNQAVYLERVYLDAAKELIAIRSDVCYEREMMFGFNVHVSSVPAGTRYILVSLTNEYRQTGKASTFEYQELEFNELEYN